MNCKDDNAVPILSTIERRADPRRSAAAGDFPADFNYDCAIASSMARSREPMQDRGHRE